ARRLARRATARAGLCRADGRAPDRAWPGQRGGGGGNGRAGPHGNCLGGAARTCFCGERRRTCRSCRVLGTGKEPDLGERRVRVTRTGRPGSGPAPLKEKSRWISAFLVIRS